MDTINIIVPSDILRIAIPIAIAVLVIFITLKLSKKFLKAVIGLIFAGFIVYLLFGYNLIEFVLNLIGIQLPNTADMFPILFL